MSSGSVLDDIDTAITNAGFDYSSSTHAFIVSYIDVDKYDDSQPEVSYLFCWMEVIFCFVNRKLALPRNDG